MEANPRSPVGIFLTKEGFPYLIGILFRYFTIPLKKFFVNDIYWYENMYLVKTIFLYKLTWRASIKDTYYHPYIVHQLPIMIGR